MSIPTRAISIPQEGIPPRVTEEAHPRFLLGMGLNNSMQRTLTGKR